MPESAPRRPDRHSPPGEETAGPPVVRSPRSPAAHLRARQAGQEPGQAPGQQHDPAQPAYPPASGATRLVETVNPTARTSIDAVPTSNVRGVTAIASPVGVAVHPSYGPPHDISAGAHRDRSANLQPHRRRCWRWSTRCVSSGGRSRRRLAPAGTPMAFIEVPFTNGDRRCLPRTPDRIPPRLDSVCELGGRIQMTLDGF